MLLERLYDEDLSQASYFVGCQQAGEAIVIDPRRDIAEYQRLASRNNLRITAVVETHIHADYLSGTRELAAATEAEVYLSGEGGEDWQYAFDGKRLYDGDIITIGNLGLTALHTPGHTPEHLSFLLTDRAVSNQPGYLFSGDFVLVGDLGRPDLLDEAAGGTDTRYEGARQLFCSLREKLLTLPDYVQIYPAHGSGSACGRALGSVPSTTVGYERRFSWWGRHLDADDESQFVIELLAGQADAPAYFGRMKRQNRNGPQVLGPRPELTELDADSVERGLRTGALIFIDSRDPAEVHQGTVCGSLNIPATGKPASYSAWAYDPESEVSELVLLAENREAAKYLRNHLVRVGIDGVRGYVTSLAGLPPCLPETIDPAELDALDYALLLDVRNLSEYQAGTIPGARQLSAGKVLWHQDQLPRAGTIVSFCQGGVRNSVAASTLRRAGHRVVELEGSYAAWLGAQQ
ncbi:MBL fold metallo-hydrolase [Arthrobacter russicus]|jgi:hydroxyacylglutathione hydrolase|uniref:Hydroxyacylglutathione hydrolase n=1 Tax=Arthrobacter russicus TaxID=172040 RepID=A0ABU1J6X3_9MICC|nr:MBL fold metallo-hydrolase [Arthrobacter russicus]MDR6268178.1 hydroxyacylglutathione hydrolase [Arthrobacter russicus]